MSKTTTPPPAKLPASVQSALDEYVKWRHRAATATDRAEHALRWMTREINDLAKPKAEPEKNSGFDYGPPPSDEDVPF